MRYPTQPTDQSDAPRSLMCDSRMSKPQANIWHGKDRAQRKHTLGFQEQKQNLVTHLGATNATCYITPKEF